MREGGNRFGTHRVVHPKGVLPQQAETLDPSLPIYENELLIDVEALNIDSASFYQIRGVCENDPNKIGQHIQSICQKRGKQHNPVTGSGGMLIGRVQEIGPKFLEGRPKSELISKGDRIATLVSLTLTPLQIKSVKNVSLETDRVEVEGHAILLQTGIYSKLPSDISETESLAVLDVAGAPAQIDRVAQKGQTVVIVGGAGKSGLLCAYVAKKKVGPTGKVIVLDYSQAQVEQASQLSFVDKACQCDARNAVKVFDLVSELTQGKMADLVVNVANVPNTEMSCILTAKKGGLVYFFSMATSFTKAVLGAEGVGSDVTLLMGNGYCPGHAELTLNILRESSEIRSIYKSKYGAS